MIFDEIFVTFQASKQDPNVQVTILDNFHKSFYHFLLTMCPGVNDECGCGIECKPWKDEGFYCLLTRPLAYREPCNRIGYCDSCVMESVLVLTNTISTNGTNQLLTNKIIQSKILLSAKQTYIITTK